MELGAQIDGVCGIPNRQLFGQVGSAIMDQSKISLCASASQNLAPNINFLLLG